MRPPKKERHSYRGPSMITKKAQNKPKYVPIKKQEGKGP